MPRQLAVEHPLESVALVWPLDSFDRLIFVADSDFPYLTKYRSVFRGAAVKDEDLGSLSARAACIGITFPDGGSNCSNWIFTSCSGVKSPRNLASKRRLWEAGVTCAMTPSTGVPAGTVS